MSALSKVKQVLVWRCDLRNTRGEKCRTGKIAAQLAHASMKAVLDYGVIKEHTLAAIPNEFSLFMTPEMEEWITGLFTKVCVSVDSEEELLDIYNKAVEAGLHCSLIQDSGLTEFGGVPTHTAVAVGPGRADEIDKITGGLKLL